MHERPIAVNIQITWGGFDEDGNLIGERADQVERIYYPFGRSLDARILEREREMQREKAEKR